LTILNKFLILKTKACQLNAKWALVKKADELPKIIVPTKGNGYQLTFSRKLVP